MGKISAAYNKESLEQIMENESAGRKCCLLISSAIHVAFAGVVGIILCAWWGN